MIYAINEADALRALVNEYLSPTVDSELFLLNKFVRMPAGSFVTVMYLDYNDLLMTNIPAVTYTFIFKIEMNLTRTTT